MDSSQTKYLIKENTDISGRTMLTRKEKMLVGAFSFLWLSAVVVCDDTTVGEFSRNVSHLCIIVLIIALFATKKPQSVHRDDTFLMPVANGIVLSYAGVETMIYTDEITRFRIDYDEWKENEANVVIHKAGEKYELTIVLQDGRRSLSPLRQVQKRVAARIMGHA